MKNYGIITAVCALFLAYSSLAYAGPPGSPSNVPLPKNFDGPAKEAGGGDSLIMGAGAPTGKLSDLCAQANLVASQLAMCALNNPGYVGQIQNTLSNH